MPQTSQACVPVWKVSPSPWSLAAARIGVLTLKEMLDEPRLDFLVSRRGDIAPRHQILRTVIASTLHAMPIALQSFFACLAVFHGGWTSEAAAFVCREAEIETTEDTEDTASTKRIGQRMTEPQQLTIILNMLEQLREFALISTEEVGETMRGQMLDTLREYGAEQLSPEEAQALAERHATYFLRLAKKAEIHVRGAEQKVWLDRLEVEHNNLRAALDWLCTEGRAQEAMRLGFALTWFWRMRGYVSEGRQQMQRILALSDAPTAERGRALRGAGMLANYQDDLEKSTRLFNESLMVAHQTNDTNMQAWGLYSLGHNSLNRSKYADARRYLEESLSLFESLTDARGFGAGFCTKWAVFVWR